MQCLQEEEGVAEGVALGDLCRQLCTSPSTVVPTGGARHFENLKEEPKRRYLLQLVLNAS